MMREQMDRSRIRIGKVEDLNQQDRDYWARATLEEKLRTITYLRECFYGSEATTGRLQRIYRVLKQA